MILRGWQVLVDSFHVYTYHVRHLLPRCAVLQHPAAAIHNIRSHYPAAAASIAALNLALLLIVLCLPPVVFDFEIQIGEVGKQSKNNTGRNTYSRPLAGAYLIEKLQQPVAAADGGYPQRWRVRGAAAGGYPQRWRITM